VTCFPVLLIKLNYILSENNYNGLDVPLSTSCEIKYLVKHLPINVFILSCFRCPWLYCLQTLINNCHCWLLISCFPILLIKLNYILSENNTMHYGLDVLYLFQHHVKLSTL